MSGQIKTIELTFPRLGLSTGASKPKIEAFGYNGLQCQEATKQFEEALGQTVDVEEKPELYQTEEGVERLKEDQSE